MVKGCLLLRAWEASVMLLRFGLLYKVSNCLPGLQYLFACLVPVSGP